MTNSACAHSCTQQRSGASCVCLHVPAPCRRRVQCVTRSFGSGRAWALRRYGGLDILIHFYIISHHDVRRMVNLIHHDEWCMIRPKCLDLSFSDATVHLFRSGAGPFAPHRPAPCKHVHAALHCWPRLCTFPLPLLNIEPSHTSISRHPSPPRTMHPMQAASLPQPASHPPPSQKHTHTQLPGRVPGPVPRRLNHLTNPLTAS